MHAEVACHMLHHQGHDDASNQALALHDAPTNLHVPSWRVNVKVLAMAELSGVTHQSQQAHAADVIRRPCMHVEVACHMAYHQGHDDATFHSITYKRQTHSLTCGQQQG